MHLQLTRPLVPLQDGSASWNTSAADALAIWNQYIDTVQFVQAAPGTGYGGDRLSSAFFSNTIYGEGFPPGVLAVTLNFSSDAVEFTETDVIFNNNLTWNSYRGRRQAGSFDFHRVALHEFGHVLGLDHPDQAGQSVTAIMNSIISDLDQLADDDIAGGSYLYGLRLTSATTVTAVAGQPFSLQLTASLPDVTFSSADLPAGLVLDYFSGLISGTPVAGGTFTVHVTLTHNGTSVTVSINFIITRTPRPIEGPTGLAMVGDEQSSPVGPNSFYFTPADGSFSAVGAADNPFGAALGTSVTFGFSNSTEQWQLQFAGPRGVPLTVGRYDGLNGGGPFSYGPALQLIRQSASAGGPGGYFEVKSVAYGTNNQMLAFDATFELFTGNGSPSVKGEARFNVDPSNPPATPTIISPLTLGAAKGAAIDYQVSASNNPTRYKVYQLPAGLSFDAATARITGIPATTGFFEIVLGAENSFGTGTARLKLSVTAPPPVHALLNIATRISVGTDADVAIGGFILTGSAPKRIIVRAVGPSLTAAGVNGVLSDPQIDVRDAVGNVIASNDNWLSEWELAQQSGLPPTHRKEGATVRTISPGAYTAIMKGVGGGTGVALVEVYDLDASSGSRFGNMSTRGRVKTGENVMIGGFIIGGDQPSRIVVRGIGPSLTASGVPGALADPMLELHDANGGVFQNDNWRENAQEIIATGLAPANDREAAIVKTLAPGNYTVILQGTSGATGVGLIEIYNLETN